jgi:hypothetical protein
MSRIKNAKPGGEPGQGVCEPLANGIREFLEELGSYLSRAAAASPLIPGDFLIVLLCRWSNVTTPGGTATEGQGGVHDSVVA